MTTQTETVHAGEFIASEANGRRSREVGVLAAGEHVAGTVLAVDGAGEYVILAPGAADGTEVAAAILYAGADATTAKQDVVVFVRDGEVTQENLTWPAGITQGQIDTALDQLAGNGIIAR